MAVKANMKTAVEGLYENGDFDAADRVIARTVQRLGGCDDPWVLLAAALVSRAASEGHVCLDLARGRSFADLTVPSGEPVTPDPDEWRRRLLACKAVGAPGDFCPLILDGRRLYLHRYWHYEQELARSILERCNQPRLYADDDPHLMAALAQQFPDLKSDQARAARLAVTRRFGVISGGPGTGKTHTVGKIILLLQALVADRPLNILLGAPTGKAAARMQAAVEAVLNRSSAQAMALVQNAQTLHRLLGYMPTAAKFRFHADHQLPADAVIVDEASMIDLVLMRQLVRSVDQRTRLILVGDKDQLASVEAGAVLGDICHGIHRPPAVNHQGSDGKPPEPAVQDAAHPLAGHIVVLGRSYRFDAHGGIGALGQAINAGDAQKVMSLLNDPHDPAITLRPLSDWAAAAKLLEPDIMAAVGPLFDCHDPFAALEQLNRFKILCAVRRGPFGVEATNRWVEQVMRRAGRIFAGPDMPPDWYPGRPVMITRNDYFQGLFNGDVGIAVKRADVLEVVFPDSQGGLKRLRPRQLPEHQTVYAMTIHKSQGSEFDHVMIVLPDQDIELLTRELIYTAVTRARRSITIWARPEVLARAIERPIQRASGLREILWK